MKRLLYANVQIMQIFVPQGIICIGKNSTWNHFQKNIMWSYTWNSATL